ncbi:MAG: UDP-N-acetylglucosamine 1-carboxyvinyltransferase [Clostridia bacterium]|nr:UDP-N-acetylglucosamine 1-carboxyvinyltransferase [Clostridia bacterium]
MERLVIVGGKKLAGEVTTSGAKNAILPIMAAALLTSRLCIFDNVPDLLDVKVMCRVLAGLGAECRLQGRVLTVDAAHAEPVEIEPDLIRRLRASNLVMGPLLGRFQRFKVAYPGGCEIGARPMDLHLKGFRLLGARIKEEYGFIEAEAESLQGTDIHLDFPSVGATENIMMAAVLAEGITHIYNAAREPEIVDLQNFLNKIGARIQGAGSDTITIEGVKNLQGAEHSIIPDRIEAGTYLAAAAITGGEILVRNINPYYLASVLAKLREMGADVHPYSTEIFLRGPSRLRAVDCKTLPYPGFPTDMQPQIMALMTLAEGTSIICESIFERRFKHASEFKRMGADIKIEGCVAVVTGVNSLSGTCVEASDLRAGAGLALAGLVAEGTTYLEGLQHLDRGYEQFEAKLQGLGARIWREKI